LKQQQRQQQTSSQTSIHTISDLVRSLTTSYFVQLETHKQQHQQLYSYLVDIRCPLWHDAVSIAQHVSHPHHTLMNELVATTHGDITLITYYISECVHQQKQYETMDELIAIIQTREQQAHACRMDVYNKLIDPTCHLLSTTTRDITQHDIKLLFQWHRHDIHDADKAIVTTINMLERQQYRYDDIYTLSDAIHQHQIVRMNQQHIQRVLLHTYLTHDACHLLPRHHTIRIQELDVLCHVTHRVPQLMYILQYMNTQVTTPYTSLISLQHAVSTYLESTSTHIDQLMSFFTTSTLFDNKTIITRDDCNRLHTTCHDIDIHVYLIVLQLYGMVYISMSHLIDTLRTLSIRDDGEEIQHMFVVCIYMYHMLSTTTTIRVHEDEIKQLIGITSTPQICLYLLLQTAITTTTTPFDSITSLMTHISSLYATYQQQHRDVLTYIIQHQDVLPKMTETSVSRICHDTHDGMATDMMSILQHIVTCIQQGDETKITSIQVLMERIRRRQQEMEQKQAEEEKQAKIVAETAAAAATTATSVTAAPVQHVVINNNTPFDTIADINALHEQKQQVLIYLNNQQQCQLLPSTLTLTSHDINTIYLHAHTGLQTMGLLQQLQYHHQHYADIPSLYDAMAKLNRMYMNDADQHGVRIDRRQIRASMGSMDEMVAASAVTTVTTDSTKAAVETTTAVPDVVSSTAEDAYTRALNRITHAYATPSQRDHAIELMRLDGTTRMDDAHKWDARRRRHLYFKHAHKHTHRGRRHTRKAASHKPHATKTDDKNKHGHGKSGKTHRKSHKKNVKKAADSKTQEVVTTTTEQKATPASEQTPDPAVPDVAATEVERTLDINVDATQVTDDRDIDTAATEAEDGNPNFLRLTTRETPPATAPAAGSMDITTTTVTRAKGRADWEEDEDEEEDLKTQPTPASPRAAQRARRHSDELGVEHTTATTTKAASTKHSHSHKRHAHTSGKTQGHGGMTQGHGQQEHIGRVIQFNPREIMFVGDVCQQTLTLRNRHRKHTYVCEIHASTSQFTAGDVYDVPFYLPPSSTLHIPIHSTGAARDGDKGHRFYLLLRCLRDTDDMTQYKSAQVFWTMKKHRRYQLLSIPVHHHVDETSAAQHPIRIQQQQKQRTKHKQQHVHKQREQDQTVLKLMYEDGQEKQQQQQQQQGEDAKNKRRSTHHHGRGRGRTHGKRTHTDKKKDTEGVADPKASELTISTLSAPAADILVVDASSASHSPSILTTTLQEHEQMFSAATAAATTGAAPLTPHPPTQARGHVNTTTTRRHSSSTTATASFVDAHLTVDGKHATTALEHGETKEQQHQRVQRRLSVVTGEMPSDPTEPTLDTILSVIAPHRLNAARRLSDVRASGAKAWYHQHQTSDHLDMTSRMTENMGSVSVAPHVIQFEAQQKQTGMTVTNQCDK
jgi:hypothetical protein